MVELCLQHLVGSPCIGFCRVRVFQVLSAVELVGSRKRALFQLVVNHLHVDKLPLGQVDVDACTEKFLYQHRYVEAVGVEAGNVGPFNVAGNVLCHFLESRAVGHILVVNAMNGSRCLRDVHFRVDAQGFGLFVAVRINLQVADFYNTVCINVGARGLQVEEHERIFQVQFHESVCNKK